MNETQTDVVPADDRQSAQSTTDDSVADRIFNSFSQRLDKIGLFSGISDDLVELLRADPLKSVSIETLLRKKRNEDS